MVHKHDIVVSYRNIPIVGWFIRKNPSNMDDLGITLYAIVDSMEWINSSMVQDGTPKRYVNVG